MAIGLGIILLVLGLILVLGVIDMPASVTDVVETGTLGWILLAAGILALVLSLVLQRQRTNTTHVEERRTDTI